MKKSKPESNIGIEGEMPLLAQVCKSECTESMRNLSSEGAVSCIIYNDIT